MMKNTGYWRQWEDGFISREPADFEKNLRLMEAMYEETKALKVQVSEDPLAGLGPVIFYAKAINVRTPTHSTRQGA